MALDRTRGFTLLEIMMATVVVAIISSISFSSLVNAKKIRMRARKKQAALIAADTWLERAYSVVDSSTLGGESAVFLDSDMNTVSSRPNWTLNFDDYAWPINIRVNSVAGHAGLVFIQVRVNFLDHYVQLRTYKSTRG